jgi:preprotein translocase subunit SecA
MFNLLENEKYTIKNYQFLLNQINLLENLTKNLTDTEIKENIYKLKKKYALNQKLSEDIIIESFSLTREASIRTIGLRHFDQQIIGGLVLNEGKIAEMKTGEGKTLVATLPIALNALTENGVHLVTVNDYLAKRDFDWMKQIYQYLGLTSGLIQSQMNENERKINYQKDITYITNSELAFDFLRDNMSSSSSKLVQRPFNYCIIDEVDSILIDEARTPLIISGQLATDSNIYIQASEISKYLKKDIHFEVDEKSNNIVLTENGIRQIEKILGISNIFETNQPWLFFIINALKAENFFLKDVQYIIQNNSICIVDEFTGRIMPDRRWNNGLHEAIEAKENISAKQSTKQLAAITYQNFFTLYPKLSGMTGTAKTAEVELEKIYNLEVTVIPTIRPFKREDLPDQVYVNEIAKWKSVAKTCALMYKNGRPILVGTNSIEKSEIISLILKDYNVPHKLLNARPENLNLESEIIAEAGCLGSIVISTNMAGRGTDIILGGNLNFKINKLIRFLNSKNRSKLEKQELKFLILKILINQMKNHHDDFFEKDYEYLTQLDFFQTKKQRLLKKIITTLFFYLKTNYRVKFDSEKKKVLGLGGLFVIGTERHESRRIDNQLRGRAGRQGDPGSSRFFISLEDKIFRLFGGNNFKKLINKFQLNNDTIPLESSLLTKSLEIAQEKVENYYYQIRKNIYEYDEVLNEQRKVFYSTRSLILNTPIIRNWILDIGEIVILELINYLKSNKKVKKNEISEQDIFELKKLLGFSFDLNLKNLEKIPSFTLFNFLREQFWLTYDIKEINSEILLPGFYRSFEKYYLLQAIDFCWSEHLEKMAELRESIVWRAYGQRDPLIEYKQEAYKLFTTTSKQIRNCLIFAILSSNLI